MIIGTGIDIIEISRIEEVLRLRENFLSRFFTLKENEYFNSRNNRIEVIAGNFAAKEAVSKALSTGFRDIKWKDIEILRDKLGKPYAVLHGKAKELLEEGILHISISHSKEFAVSNVILERV